MNYRVLFLSLALCAALLPTALLAQSSNDYNSDIASAYSRYGLGVLSPRQNGFNASMAGAGLALRAGNRINAANPASYSSVDSLTFLLDVGMTLDRSTLKFNNITSHQNGARLQYVNIAFQLVRHLGMSVGYTPITSIGYDYKTKKFVGWNDNTNQQIHSANTYFGTGGLHQVYVGLGYAPIRHLSVGVNAGYIWGEYNHAATQTFTENGTTISGYNTLTTLYQADLSSYNIEAGIQYTQPIGRKQSLGIGATVGIGHRLNNDASFYRYTTGNDTTKHVVPKAFELPMTYGVGVAYTHTAKLKVAADFTYEQWASCTLPYLNDDNIYVSEPGQFKNRMTYRCGAEYCPDALSRKYINRICYRIGAYYNTPYVIINNNDGPKEYGVTAGFSLPITNSFNNRSVVNVGFKWSHIAPSVPGMISENQISLSVGLTFNEKWFAKWRIE